jgi:hypothetical protein
MHDAFDEHVENYILAKSYSSCSPSVCDEGNIFTLETKKREVVVLLC